MKPNFFHCNKFPKKGTQHRNIHKMEGQIKKTKKIKNVIRKMDFPVSKQI